MSNKEKEVAFEFSEGLANRAREASELYVGVIRLLELLGRADSCIQRILSAAAAELAEDGGVSVEEVAERFSLFLEHSSARIKVVERKAGGDAQG